MRELGHGIYPTDLRQLGLVDALRSVANAVPIRVRVSADTIGRYAPTIEGNLSRDAGALCDATRFASEADS